MQPLLAQSETQALEDHMRQVRRKVAEKRDSAISTLIELTSPDAPGSPRSTRTRSTAPFAAMSAVSPAVMVTPSATIVCEMTSALAMTT